MQVMLIATLTGESQGQQRKGEPEYASHKNLAWVEIKRGATPPKPQPGQGVERTWAAAPMPFDEKQTKWVEGWELTGTPTPPPPPSTLDEVKAKAKQSVTPWKHGKQKENFTHAGVDYEADDLSRDYISGAVVNSLIAYVQTIVAVLEAAGMTVPPPPVSINWTAADNSIVPLDADGMIAMGQSLAKNIGALHDLSTKAKSDIDAAADEPGVQAVLDALA